jgi:rhodanese-related sulfurtransferase
MTWSSDQMVSYLTSACQRFSRKRRRPELPWSRPIAQDAIPSGRALAQLPNDKPIVLHCKTGVRSAEVLAAVKDAGFKDAVHVQGGVTSWATRIDKALPTY